MASILLRIVYITYVTWATFVFATLMLVITPFALPPLMTGISGGVISFWFFRLWARLFSALTFIRYEIRGRENIKRGIAYVFVSNHTSLLDAPGLVLAIPGQFRPLGKRELLRIPVFGLVVKAAAVVVDRADPESRKLSTERLKRYLASRVSILIFPEGTQNRSDKALQPFYSGAFRIAVETDAVVVPIVVLGAGRLMTPGRLDIRPGTIKVVIGEPIGPGTGGEEGVELLRQKVFDVMSVMIKAEKV